MILFYGLDTKEFFQDLLSKPHIKNSKALKITYNEQLLKTFTLFFGQILYLVYIQNYLVSLVK